MEPKWSGNRSKERSKKHQKLDSKKGRQKEPKRPIMGRWDRSEPSILDAGESPPYCWVNPSLSAPVGDSDGPSTPPEPSFPGTHLSSGWPLCHLICESFLCYFYDVMLSLFLNDLMMRLFTFWVYFLCYFCMIRKPHFAFVHVFMKSVSFGWYCVFQ